MARIWQHGTVLYAMEWRVYSSMAQHDSMAQYCLRWNSEIMAAWHGTLLRAWCYCMASCQNTEDKKYRMKWNRMAAWHDDTVENCTSTARYGTVYGSMTWYGMPAQILHGMVYSSLF